MAYDTVILQGRFTSSGANQTITLRSDVDWMWVYNETAANQAAADLGFEFNWQRGMTDGRGSVKTKLGTVANDPLTVGQIAAGAGFFLVDTSVSVPTAAVALTAMTGANPPVVTSASLPSVGDIVRLSNLDNQPQVGGIDFTVTASGGGTFTIGNISLVNSVASTAGFWRRIPFDPMFYPRRRFITYISSEAQAKVYMSVTHQFTVGQQVRLSLPGGIWEAFNALDGVSATIVAVNAARAGNEPNNGGTANSITIDVDTSAFAAWNSFGAANNEAYPPAGDYPFAPAQVVPIGEDTAQAISSSVDILGDATINQAQIAMILAPGTLSPAGQANDVIYWRAGKSFSVDNQ